MKKSERVKNRQPKEKLKKKMKKWSKVYMINLTKSRALKALKNSFLRRKISQTKRTDLSTVLFHNTRSGELTSSSTL